jgi:phosphoglycerate-specific signal transduction histidine kinase
MSDSERLTRLEGQIDALKVVRPMTIAVVSVVLAALVFLIGFLGLQVQATNAKFEARLDQVDAKFVTLDAKIDAIPQRLEEEFRAMRAEMSAQTGAIAGAITATKQQAPQVIMIPATGSR